MDTTVMSCFFNTQCRFRSLLNLVIITAKCCVPGMDLDVAVATFFSQRKLAANACRIQQVYYESVSVTRHEKYKPKLNSGQTFHPHVSCRPAKR